jgi:hypothetical protein
MMEIDERDCRHGLADSQQEQADKLRGSHIKSNWFHDAGAYARCSYCGRYSDSPKSLDKGEHLCECGKLHGWTGSFAAPNKDSQWSDATN